MASPAPGTGSIPTQSSPTTTAASDSSTSVFAAADPVSTASLPALTTQWVSPQSCTWTYVVSDPKETAGPGATAWLDLEPIPGATTLSCYPDGMFSSGLTGIFSPGTCPGGWTTATLLSSTHSEQSAIVTTAVCCSNGYSLVDNHCRRAAPTALAVPITYNQTGGTYEVFSLTTTTLYSADLAVNTIRVLFTDNEKKGLGIDTDDGARGRSLSKGDCVGIAIGVAAIILLLLGAVYFIIIRRRRSREGLTEERLIQDLKSMRGDSASGMYARPAYFSPEMSSAVNSPLVTPPPAYGGPRPRERGSASSSDSRGRRNTNAYQSAH